MREEGCSTVVFLLGSSLKNWVTRVTFTEVRTVFSSLLISFTNFIWKLERVFEVFLFLWKSECLIHGKKNDRFITLILET